MSAILFLECLEAQKLWSASFQALGKYEYQIFASPDQLRESYCHSPPHGRKVKIYWKRDDEWDQICNFEEPHIAERYWKLVAAPKIGLSLLGSFQPEMESIILR